uniref:Uncharacterized protein n=1 Tax=Romanomermis culicivorax TaxID=13658 RepID=A0A915JVR7_ROMCU
MCGAETVFGWDNVWFRCGIDQNFNRVRVALGCYEQWPGNQGVGINDWGTFHGVEMNCGAYILEQKEKSRNSDQPLV